MFLMKLKLIVSKDCKNASSYYDNSKFGILIPSQNVYIYLKPYFK
jgi:hypothetical protein